ncbi:response regulator [Pelobium manganitolerans]|uniref:response regulator n=1 Tax=Pelobium manganitolerans TaxID=1842495 RepID=UPI003FA3909C
MEKLFWIADDDPDDRMIINDAFSESAYCDQLAFFEDGEQLLQTLKKKLATAPSAVPALLILDLNMPKVNGVEVLQSIKKNKSTSGIPVVILSTSKSERDKEKAIKLGANEFITKPISFDMMVEITRNLIEKYGKYETS